MRTTIALIIVIFYLVTAAVVAALDPGSDTGSAIASGLLWPLAAQQAQSIRTRVRAVLDEGLPRKVTTYGGPRDV